MQPHLGRRVVGDGDADAGADGVLAWINGHRLAQYVKDAFGDEFRAGVERLEEHDELVASHSSDGIGLAHNAREPRGSRLQ